MECLLIRWYCLSISTIIVLGIPEDAVSVLERYLWQRGKNDSLFFNSRGGKLNKMYISRLLKKYAAKAEIPSYSAEALRNACAFTMFAYKSPHDKKASQSHCCLSSMKPYFVCI